MAESRRDRIVEAALAIAAERGWANLRLPQVPERLMTVMMRWFDALAPHRSVVREMLREKLYPGHPQHWGPLIADLSRLIHWFLDAARITSTGRERQLA